ncbi:MAG: N-acetylglucosamine-6-phosphate deacetylase [Clostridiales bacterium]|nr:N-acetylglucosamine-6-phosphate deacetylase [Clostridiales bacterium]
MILKNTVYYNEAFLPQKGDIAIENGILTEVGGTQGGRGIDLSGCTVAPGFIDIHTHGAMGGDTCDAREESLAGISRHLAHHGVTSFCPTTMTLPFEQLAESLQAARDYRGYECGAYIQGINMEGPYISAAKKGAQCGDYIRNPDFNEFLKLYEICPVRLVDVAPEANGANEFAARAKAYCTVSAAHTNSDYETAAKAFDAGFSHATHLFNAMTQLSSRAPGVVGAVFDNDAVTAELICDGFHIAPATLRIAFRILGEDRTVIVSDAMMASGLADGDFELGGQTVYVRDGKALLADGTIAASTTNLYDEFRNVLRFGIPFRQALKSCTINPARVIHADKETGSIAQGKRADLLVLDRNMEIRMVIVKGEIVVNHEA